MTNKTLDYYNNHAQSFIDGTFHADVSETIKIFTKNFQPGDKVLDVGCGSGRDSLYFLNAGLDVVAFDASSEIARQASEKINHPVLVRAIEEMEWEGEFDGVWAMASLLHLPKKDIVLGLTNCMRACKDGGKFLATFKIGEGEAFDDRGRFFSYYSPSEIRELFLATGLTEQVELDIQEDTLGRAGLSWVSVVCTVSLNPQHEVQESYDEMTEEEIGKIRKISDNYKKTVGDIKAERTILSSLFDASEIKPKNKNK